MAPITSISTQRRNRSWIWAHKRRPDATTATPHADLQPAEAPRVKQAMWPYPRASWLPPLTS